MQYLARVEAAIATKDHFLGLIIDFKTVDCLRLVAYCLKQLGHKKPTKGVRKYTCELGAVRALKASGYANLVEAVDAYGLTRIPPASALAGDIIAYESDTFGGYALGVCLGDNKFLGFAPAPYNYVDTAEIWAASHAWRSV